MRGQQSQKSSTIEVNDIIETMWQHNFSTKQQIEVLEVLDFALCKKCYPQDVRGIIKSKIKLLELAEQEIAKISSNLFLSFKKGTKVNFLRIINCMCELGFFADKNGNSISKKEVFSIVGQSINQDLSSFHNDLSSAKAAANSDMKSAFAIFELMHTKQQEISRK
jgi:hypothetical protein